jgi:hypothetical protein
MQCDQLLKHVSIYNNRFVSGVNEHKRLMNTFQIKPFYYCLMILYQLQRISSIKWARTVKGNDYGSGCPLHDGNIMLLVLKYRDTT